MAISQINLRSISLPSRLPSNNSTNFESMKNINSVPTSSQNIQSGLLELAQLYCSVHEHTEFPSSQRSHFLQHHLDASMELIDTCNNINDMFRMIKENVQSLQSAIRRKSLDSSSIQDDISTYLCFRKKMSKNINKSLKTIKNLEKKNEPMGSFNADDHDGIVMIIREATEATLAIFRGILMYLSCPNIARFGGWNLVSKLMITKPASDFSSRINVGEVGSVDLALTAKVVDGQMAQRSLQNLDSCIESLESGLEILFRQLIRCRVTILNVLTDH